MEALFRIIALRAYDFMLSMGFLVESLKYPISWYVEEIIGIFSPFITETGADALANFVNGFLDLLGQFLVFLPYNLTSISLVEFVIFFLIFILIAFSIIAMFVTFTKGILELVKIILELIPG